jgi:hypothetical protein
MKSTAEYCFDVATRADKWGGVVFYIAFTASVVLAVSDNPQTDAICHPCLIAAAALAILSTAVTTIYQTEGNRFLRATQLSHALGAGAGEPIRADYYNNNLPQSLLKLAATTLENTMFTKDVLSKMAVKMRFKTGLYVVLLLILFTCRATPTGWLLVLAQTLFSADLLLKLVRLERFRVRTVRVHERLEQFFLLTGSADRPNHLAVLIGAFADYECAKDEAAIPLESKYFEELNEGLSIKWVEMKIRLNIN